MLALFEGLAWSMLLLGAVSLAGGGLVVGLGYLLLGGAMTMVQLAYRVLFVGDSWGSVLRSAMVALVPSLVLGAYEGMRLAAPTMAMAALSGFMYGLGLLLLMVLVVMWLMDSS